MAGRAPSIAVRKSVVEAAAKAQAGQLGYTYDTVREPLFAGASAVPEISD